MAYNNNTAATTVIAGGVIPNVVTSSYTFAASNPTVGASLNQQGLDLRNGADIKIDGISLKDFMEKVSMRLNMMVPNPKLEREWEELRTLGEAYRACEKECMDKAKVWDILKRDN